MAKSYRQWGIYLSCAASVCIVIAVISSFTGHWVMNDNPYCSYTIQACAWLDGRLDVGDQYTWLELAIYNGKYYVSFPPFPSVVLLPFAAIFGMNTPDHLISLAFTLMGVIYALKLYQAVVGKLEDAQRYVLFLFLANGYLFISMQGWVWYLAQCMCFALSLMALYYAATGRGGWALLLWMFGIGCRPMVIVYLPILIDLLLKQQRKKRRGARLSTTFREKWYWAIPAMVVGLGYMILNDLRFDNPLEFGHNYLPEFVRAEKGQFSLDYLGENFRMLWRLPTLDRESGKLSYYTFDCMAFWLIAPITVSFLFAWYQALQHGGRKNAFLLIALPLSLGLHLMILCCHRTLGGYQFGNRYIVDMLPYVFYGLLAYKPKQQSFSQTDAVLFMLGFSVNLIGTVATYNHWI